MADTYSVFWGYIMTGEASTFLEGNISFVCSVSFALHTGLKTRVQ